ncbi:polysaccharide deacetylase family protein [Lysobacter enzymogenes]|uniref:polysaccharide deacetylase family protein n=1 Tax=Lysobacter enzymogenes TaxID=69 RepID=UPI000BBAEF50|nr:polysaccharide deacetylase family protein [Lysobacter enzymogenes]
MPPTVRHRPPRHPEVALWLFAASQLAVLGLWWAGGWRLGLPALALSHLTMVWGTLRPGSALFSPVLRRLPTREPVVWLTIDDGPSDDTEAMLDLLDAHAAKATFFVVAERARARPELLAQIVRRGHGVGHHSASHPSAAFWRLGPAAMRREIVEADRTLRELLPGYRLLWFRAVVGMANPFVARWLKRCGLARVAWSARGYDAVAAEPGRVVARVERDLAPGAIVLMHEGAGHGRSVETMAALLGRLGVLGYRCVLPEASE